MNPKDFEIWFKKIMQTRNLNKIAQTQFALRLTELTHRLSYEMRNNRMKQAMERFKNCDNKKPKSQIQKEINLCKNFWKCYPLHYYRYDLYKKEKELSKFDLLNFIPEFYYYYLFLPFYYPKKYENIVSDKNKTEQFFRRNKIPQAPTICKLINNHFYDNELKEKSFNCIEQKMKENEPEKIFVKAISHPRYIN